MAEDTWRTILRERGLVVFLSSISFVMAFILIITSDGQVASMWNLNNEVTNHTVPYVFLVPPLLLWLLELQSADRPAQANPVQALLLRRFLQFLLTFLMVFTVLFQLGVYEDFRLFLIVSAIVSLLLAFLSVKQSR